MDEQNNVNMGDAQSGGSAGPVIGIIVILVIIILGGLYFWNQRSSDIDIDENLTSEVIDSINTQSEEDTTSSIETDLNNTEIENLDAEINAS